MTTTRRRFVSGLSAAPLLSQSRRQRPNILLLFPDQHRYDWTGFNKDVDVRTPNLEKLAARGVRFTQAIVGSPLCAPSRACIASGKEYARCGVASNGQNFPLTQTTFYTLLRDSGYHVMGCGKLDLHKASESWGLDGKGLIREWGFSDAIDNAGKYDAIVSGRTAPKDPYMAMLYRRKLAQAHIDDFEKRRKDGHNATYLTPLPDDAYCDNWIGQNGLDLLGASPKDKPWFLAVNFTGPHNPWDITASMERGIRDRTRYPKANANTQYPAEDHLRVRQNYSAMVENLDRWTGRYIDELRKRGELDNTIVLYGSDHGEMLGDHNRWGKTVPYQASEGVPLVAAGPGIEKGKTSSTLVTLVDLAATFLDYAGVAKPKEMDSVSLRPVLEGRRNQHRPHVASALGKWRSISDGNYKLVTGFEDKGPALFDVKDDPLENTNLAAKKPAETERLSRLMAT